ncbi:MAG: hypothetical protein A3I05_05625 [Deltaproteobacteria bacterium RIFCSPLOWO2_02_FULL_44_10]|nr:MAG: hypothetical protein A3C46_06375 [Deltaproteobacteria bacterium RIFCSPHIGHO2_02_FULL_44_16]OGQ46073.1 MAG: hypothetical protein A3I05_05625 [Deltaproteobacteria bacterium RIFCSPLOWO2_02_FULL_44_10]
MKSANLPATQEGRQYHIGLAPGEVAPFILLCGDPKRARRIATYFKKARPEITNREYVTITGEYQGIPLTVMATGMGPDNTEMAFVELTQIVKSPTMIRVGTSGGLSRKLQLGDQVISTGAVRLENTSTFFVSEGYPALAHHECILALIEAAERKKVSYHVGVTATASGFYGAQGRKIPNLPSRVPNLPATLDAMNVLNFEMEASCLFSLGTLAGIRTGAICTTVANRHFNIFMQKEDILRAEKECLEAGLEAFVILHHMDNARKKKKHWSPSMGCSG